jgi:hypothetical protein
VSRIEVEDELEHRRRPSFLTRLADQLVPSLVVGAAVLVVGVKVMEYRIEHLSTSVKEQSLLLVDHSIKVAQNHERYVALTTALTSAIAQQNALYTTFDQRLRDLERSDRAERLDKGGRK